MSDPIAAAEAANKARDIANRFETRAFSRHSLAHTFSESSAVTSPRFRFPSMGHTPLRCKRPPDGLRDVRAARAGTTPRNPPA